MYYEETLINGIIHWRNDPDGEFTAYTLEELSVRYEGLLLHHNELSQRLYALTVKE